MFEMRTRLSTEQRRAQLLAIGAELFGKHSYDEVSIDEVAEIAEISCGLLYHYFPSKRAFFLAVVEDQSARLLQASTPAASSAPLDQLNAGLQVYIDYAEHHPDRFRLAHHAAVIDNDLGRIHGARVSAHREQILTALSGVMAVNDETKTAVAGWLAFVPAAIIDWLDNPVIAREQLRDLCARALWAALGISDP